MSDVNQGEDAWEAMWWEKRVIADCVCAEGVTFIVYGRCGCSRNDGMSRKPVV